MNIVQRIALGVLWLYQRAVSPFLHTLVGPFGGCRFHPTCSVYAAEAVRRHGATAGSLLAAQRICRCHPWGGCGEDPVPENFSLPLARKGSAQ
ncbi:MAG TPA: membrane protein insertion efficiency factor YidD [Methylomirabilota bacterium]|nr:membrane protein insertion efficiency factor YidD [Methylomirabilota bacterium]